MEGWKEWGRARRGLGWVWSGYKSFPFPACTPQRLHPQERPVGGSVPPLQERGPQDLMQVAVGRAGPEELNLVSTACLRAADRSPDRAGRRPRGAGCFPDGSRVPGLALS